MDGVSEGVMMAIDSVAVGVGGVPLTVGVADATGVRVAVLVN